MDCWHRAVYPQNEAVETELKVEVMFKLNE